MNSTEPTPPRPTEDGPGALRFRTLDDLEPRGRQVLVRVDFNVPVKDGRVTDDTRLVAALPTLYHLLDGGAALVLMSHLGRPKGVDEALRMAPVATRLAELLGRPVQFFPQVVGPEVEAAARSLAPGDIMLVDNLRFEPGEKANDPAFSRQLAALGNVYVNDAFGTAHRAESSTTGVADYLPAYAGRLMERELVMLGGALHDPARPFIVILGGAKIADKLGVIGALLPKCDRLLVGGGMANTFLAADGVPMGDSLVETEQLDTARHLKAEAGDRLQLPTDLVIADAFDAAAQRRVIPVTESVPAGWRALDIGPATADAFASALQDAKTVLWNGPMGVFELEPFAAGTLAVARAVAALTPTAPRRSSAGATRPPPSRAPASPGRCRGCRPAAAHRSSSSRASHCPPSKP